jgi:hypothetical protein
MNVEMPPPPNSTQSYVVDRLINAVTRVSIKPDGTDPDHSCVRPEISADGSLVAFASQAFNLTPNAFTDFDRVYAAVHFEITPEEQSVSGGVGGAATYDVVTQQHTPWWIDWNEWQPWIDFETPPMGFGSGMLKIRANEANPSPMPRTATIKILGKSARFTQLAGLSVTGISPDVGPDGGGTQVTFTGTGFEPGMRVLFDGLDAVATEFVSSTTLIATTPAHAPGTVWVGIVGAPPDYRNAWLDAAFRYTDTTPPQLWYGFSDNPNENGWFNRDVTLYWAWYDNETDVTSTSGCETAVIGVDTPGTTYTCTVTSEGGTSSLSAFVKRDATAPTATITSPQFALYDLNEVVQPAFTCSDALSGVASCVGSTSGQPIDTSTPGYHSFGVSITDRAGNRGYVSVDYAVGSGVCAYPLPDMVSWWRMEGNTSNMRTSVATPATRVGLTSDVYVDAVVGQGYQFEGANGYLQTNYAPTIFNDKKLALAAWVKPSADTRGTIMRARELFGIARLETGNIGWAFRKFNVPGLSYRDTGVNLPLGRWSHVVVMLDGTTVRTYLNGRLAHTEPNVGDVYNPSNYTVTLGGSDSNTDYFKGVLDEPQIFQHGLNDAEIEQLFLAGNAGACVPKRTSFQIAEPIAAAFGSPTYAFDVRLVDEDGQPVAGRQVELLSQVGAWPYSTSTANRVTDTDGRAHWDAPLENAPRGLFDGYTLATFVGDIDYVRASAAPDVLVGKGNPIITWPAPAPITYSFPVNSTQLNATANVPGTLSYSPSSGTLLSAGERTLSVTFTPTDTANYNTVTATNTLIVNKAAPNVVIEAAGTWPYTGTPRAVVGKVKDRFNVVIAMPTVTYNGSPDAPTLPGAYTVEASFAGNANYTAGSVTATLTITKSVVDIQINVNDVTYNGSPFAAGVIVSGVDPDFFPPDSVTYNGSPDNPVDAGTYTVVATFNGTAIYESATATKTFTIHQATPTVTVTGGTFTYNGQPHQASGFVTGVADASLGTPTFTYNGNSQPPVTVGTYEVVASFAGNANYEAASATTAISILKATPILGWTPPQPIVYGTPLGNAQLNATASIQGTFTYSPAAGTVLHAGASQVLTATFTPSDPNYSSDGIVNTVIDVSKASPVLNWAQPAAIVYGTPLGIGQLNATSNVTGTFAYSPAAGSVLRAGSHPLTATFTPADPGNYTGGSVSTSIAVATAPLTIRANDAAKPFGAPLPLFSASAAGFVNGDTFASLIGALGFATTATPQSPVGAYPIAVSGVSSPNYTITYLIGTLAVVRGGVTVAVTTSPAPSGLNQSMTFTATVTAAAPAVGAPGGTVRFFDGSRLLGGGALTSGTASLTTAGLAAGVHTIQATYDGDASFEEADGSASHTVNTAASTPAVALMSNRNPSTLGQSVTLTANLSMSAGPVTGTVQFYDGATLLGSSAIVSGSASFTTTVFAAGSHAITVRYPGSATAPPTISSVFVQAVGASNWKNRTSSTTLSASPNPSALGAPVTLTANVTGSNGTPAGAVLFMVNGQVVGGPVTLTAVSGSTAQASLVLSGLAGGRHLVTATYLGSSNYKGSTANLTQTVN